MSARIDQTVEVIEHTIRTLLDQGMSPKNPPGLQEVSRARNAATRSVAKRRGCKQETVISKYSTQMGRITTKDFDQALLAFLAKGDQQLIDRLLQRCVNESDQVKVGLLLSPFIEPPETPPPPPLPNDGVASAFAWVLKELEGVLRKLEDQSQELVAQRNHQEAAEKLAKAAEVTQFERRVRTLQSEWHEFWGPAE